MVDCNYFHTRTTHTLPLFLSLSRTLHFLTSLTASLHFTSLHVTPGHVTPLTHSHATCECGPPEPLNQSASHNLKERRTKHTHPDTNKEKAKQHKNQKKKTIKPTNKHRNTQTNTTKTHTNKHTNKETNKQTNKQANKQARKQASKQASKQANKDIHTYVHTYIRLRKHTHQTLPFGALRCAPVPLAAQPLPRKSRICARCMHVQGILEWSYMEFDKALPVVF